MRLDSPLLDDDRYIASLIACDVRKWRSVKQRLLAKGKLLEIEGKKLDAPAYIHVRICRRNMLKTSGHIGEIASAEARKSKGDGQANASSRIDKTRSRIEKKGFTGGRRFRGSGNDRASHWRGEIEAMEAALDACIDLEEGERIEQRLAFAKAELAKEVG